MRCGPALAFGLRVGKQVHPAVGMRAGVIALKRRSAKDLAQPAQIKIFRKRFSETAGPGPAQAVNLTRCCFQPSWKRLLCVGAGIPPGSHGREETNFLEPSDERSLTLEAVLTRTVFPEDVDLIDEHLAVGAAQHVFHFQGRHSFENFCGGCAQKSEQDFQPRNLLQLQPRLPGASSKTLGPRCAMPSLCAIRADSRISLPSGRALRAERGHRRARSLGRAELGRQRYDRLRRSGVSRPKRSGSPPRMFRARRFLRRRFR